jgi:hypothetical protein
MSPRSRTSTLRRLHTVIMYSYCKEKGKAHSVCFLLLLHILWQLSFSTHQTLPKDDLSTSPIRAVICNIPGFNDDMCACVRDASCYPLLPWTLPLRDISVVFFAKPGQIFCGVMFSFNISLLFNIEAVRPPTVRRRKKLG